MASNNISSISVGDLTIQSGNGIPNHIAVKGSIYVDMLTAIEYINKDGIAMWVQFLDSTYVFTGGTGSFSGGTFNVNGFSTAKNIYVNDEGTHITSALSSLDFVGPSVLATDDGNGNVTVTIDSGGSGKACSTSTTLIASHSGNYIQTNGMNSDTFYIGDDRCGWDTCSWNVTSQITKNKNVYIPQEFLNCGIPIPIDIIEGDTITLCGVAICGDAFDGDKFNMGIEYFGCKNYSEGTFETVYLVDDFSVFINKHTCFSLSYTIKPMDKTIASCESFIVLGFRGDFGVESTEVKLTWSLNVVRDCNYIPARNL